MSGSNFVGVPFISSKADLGLLGRRFRGAPCVRMRISDLETGYSPPNRPLWIGTDLDAYPDFFPKSDWAKWASARLPGHDTLSDGKELSRADAKALVEMLCESALGFDPKWLSVPQLPQAPNRAAAKNNKLLARAFGDWANQRGFTGTAILPIVFTHHTQIEKKGVWGPRIRQACTRYKQANADGVWIVDSTMDDLAGTRAFETQRFPQLIAIHEQVRATFPELSIHLGGPYWGLNLLLWARGIISHPAVNLSGAVIHKRPGAYLPRGLPRVALGPLRKLVVLDRAKLTGWLRKANRRLGDDHPATNDFSNLLTEIEEGVLTDEAARIQVADFYEAWVRQIAAHPAEARAVSLYQDLSQAFVVGKALEDVPGQSGRRRMPFLPAQQLMLHCI